MQALIDRFQAAGSRLVASLWLLLLFSSPHAVGQEMPAPGAPPALGSFAIEPSVALAGVPFEVKVVALDADGELDPFFAGAVNVTVRGRDGATQVQQIVLTPAERGRATLPGYRVAGDGTFLSSAAVEVVAGAISATHELVVVPGWVSIVPPLLAIAIALIFRQVVLALSLGVLFGALVIGGFDPIRALFAFNETYLLRAITGVRAFEEADTSHAKIILFSLLLGGMVGVISRSGGMHGVVDWLTRFARTRRSGQVATASLGSAVFFDDYANCLIVGNTMRPLTDRLRISREKLAYIVDSTAAPVASLIPLSTWVGYQVGLVADAVKPLDGVSGSAYSLVLQAIPYMFYPIFALLLVFLVVAYDRDAFAMLKAERRAARTGAVVSDRAVPLAGAAEEAAMTPTEGKPRRAINAVVPILAVVGVTIGGLIVTGRESADLGGAFFDDVRSVIENADSYAALLWASISGLVLAIVLPILQGILSPNAAMDACVAGMKAMFLAFVILVLSWALGDVSNELHAKDWLAGQPSFVPLITFGLASATAFATGTSWGTMGILVPLVIPLAHGLSLAAGLGEADAHSILLGSIASVLGGAVFGDHCSPISDTTVLSSMASSCDHIDHVTTQFPYAVVGALFAVGAGYLPEAYGYSIFLTLPIGLVVMFLTVRFLFRPVLRDGDNAAVAPPPPVDVPAV
jgi:Na+/H+ antiporter NhaC